MDEALSSPVLEALSDEERSRLLDRAVTRRLDRDEILFLAGHPGDRIYLVLSGVMKLAARDSEGRETILGLAVPGDLVGEVAALDGTTQPLDAVAMTPARLAGIEAETLLDVVCNNPLAGLWLARGVATRTRWICDAALERTSSEVPARLAGRLLDLAQLLGCRNGAHIDLELPMAQSDLGRLAGMCRESACKTMRRFKKQGLLDYEGRKLRILRPDVLERIRCAGRGGGPSR